MIRPFSIAALCLAVVAADATAQRRGRKRAEEPKLEHFTTETERFESPAVDGEGSYRVYLPKGYEDEENADTTYPLVIWLHGMWEDHNRFHSRGGASVLDRLRGDDEIPELIFVCPNGGRSSFYVNAKDGKANVETMIADDLIAHLEATYRIDENRRARAIAGVSMGGYGALKIALKHPAKFGTVVAHSAAVLPRDTGDIDKQFPWLERWGGAKKAMASIFGYLIDQEAWRAENLLYLTESIDPETLDGLKIYLDCGDADEYGFYEPNEELAGILEEREIAHTWRSVRGGDHGWTYIRNQLPESMRFVRASFAVDKATAGLGGLFGGNGGSSPKPDGK